MRSIPTNFGRVYPTGNFTTYLQVLAYNSTQASYKDLTQLQGIDWVRQLQWNDSVDDSGITAKVSLQRDVWRMSFSPLIVGSRLNNAEALILPGRRMRLSTACMPQDTAPAASDYVLQADLHLDTVDFAKDVMELTLTDWIVALLRNTYIDTQRTYGTGYVLLDTVMQGVLDDNINTPLGYTTGNGKKITLQLPGGSSGYAIAAPTVQKSNVLDALNTLANSIGWCLRSKFTGTAFQLCFYPPTRSTATSLYTLTPSMYDDITQASVSKTDIRNYIFGFYTDSTSGLRQMVIAQDATSIAKYGDPPMKMELTEAANSQINTLAQMNTLLGNALSDLKDPLFQYGISLPYSFFMEVGDVYTLAPNAVTHDVAQKCGVTTLGHTVGKGGMQTTLTVRGQPAGLYKRWFAAEARPGVGPSANMLDPAAPSVSAVSNVGTLTVNYTVADINNWSTTEVYLSTSSFVQPAQVNGKNQRPTTATLAAKGRLAHFTINGLTPGGAYYVAVVVIDRDGNIGTMSNVFSTSTQTVGPYHENLQGQQDQLVRNPDLNIYTLGSSSPPDNWYIDPQQVVSPTPIDPWLSSMQSSVNNNTGKYAITLAYNANGFFGTQSAFYYTYCESQASQANTSFFFPTAGTSQRIGHMFMCQPFPVAGGEIITAAAFASSSVAGTAAGIRLILWLFSCDVNGLPITNAYTANRFLLTTSLSACTLPGYAMNSGARYARLLALAVMPTSGQTMTFDRFYVNRALATLTGATSSVGGIPANSLTVITLPGDVNGNFTNIQSAGTFIAMQCKYPGNYNLSVQGGLRNGSSTTASNISIYIEVSTNSGSTWTQIAVGYGTVSSTSVPVNIAAAANTSLNVGDQVRFTCMISQSGVHSTGPFALIQTSKADR